MNRLATRVGSYQAGMGCSTHDVFDLPVSALTPFARDHVSDKYASDAAFTVLRLYVPKGERGQIGDIGLINELYIAPAQPWYSTSGHHPMYVAPADLPKYKNHSMAAESRPPKNGHQQWSDPNWRPGPGDRFRVWEY